MKNKRNQFILLLIFIFTLTSGAFAQNIKYRDYKNKVSTKNYRQKIENPKYSPALAGVLNIFVYPSIGYYYLNEPVRGLAVLGSELIASGAFVTGLVMSLTVDHTTGQSPNGARAIMFSGVIVGGIIQTWSLFDVIKIAKVKNLAYQNAKVSLSLQPDLLIVNQNAKNKALGGISLSYSF